MAAFYLHQLHGPFIGTLYPTTWKTSPLYPTLEDVSPLSYTGRRLPQLLSLNCRQVFAILPITLHKRKREEATSAIQEIYRKYKVSSRHAQRSSMEDFKLGCPENAPPENY
ncbi:hypothetical protein E6O75_ATG05858 [Venturia nashicola]|uniref:Uncharacterized protein n=1 Tax=Venturia nashicola TaxID=86259 RepID=A0A4Z1NVS3_9PEZI|nr:hypothetical protein E6O75_ATG05858 [Venturia nashicola]